MDYCIQIIPTKKEKVKLLSFFCLRPDSTLSNSAKRALESLGFKILSVKIADGKARGGERVLIITYYSNSDSNKHGREVILGLEMGYTLNKNTNSKLDSTMLVVGNPYNGW